MKQRFSQVKSLKTLVLDSKSNILIILMNWQNIVGKSNSRNMMPVELKQKTLTIAVPNNMVLSVASKFSAVIINKTNHCFETECISKLKFEIKPEFFKKTKSEKKNDTPQVPEISEEEICQKKQELITRFNLNDNIAECAARIELLNIKRGKNEQ
ncbi:DUF721 domain-containing protein [bacterium]|nr:DUF721 domain-containing protein [bacterium]